MNIYLIEAKTIWPVGNAGAVVVANASSEALQLVYGILDEPSQPKVIGEATSLYQTAQIIFINSTEY